MIKLVGQIELSLEFLQQVENLCLNRHIQGDEFVSHDQTRSQRQGASYKRSGDRSAMSFLGRPAFATRTIIAVYQSTTKVSTQPRANVTAARTTGRRLDAPSDFSSSS